MKGFVLGGFDAMPELRDDLAEPAVGQGEVLVRVRSSSVNPVDAAIAAGVLRGMVEYDFPVVLGRDYAGVVEQVGSAAGSYRVGDSVFGFLLYANPSVHDGSWCELIVVPEDNLIAAGPVDTDSSSVGAAPLAGITAVTAIDALDLSDGDTVLIVGATGGVGSIASQLAARIGATVIAPALPEDEEYLHSLGVAHVVGRNADLTEGVDALLDLVSYTPDALDAYAALVKDAGRIASTNGAAGDGPGRVNVGAVPSTENLRRLAGLLEEGTIVIPIQHAYTLADAAAAMNALATQHTQGKIAITVT